MVRLGGAASPAYISVFRGLQSHFQRQGIDLDWLLYANYDALVEGFIKHEVDIAWNALLAYVKIKRRLAMPCKVIAMRDVDLNFTTHVITAAPSELTSVQDLKGKKVALGSRGSMQAGVLPYYFLQQLGLNPAQDFAACSYYDDRQGGARSDERDVVERVLRQEFDAGAVSQRTLDLMQAEGALDSGRLRVLWSSPGYNHCCFTVHGDMDPALITRITQAFVSVSANDPAGKAVLDGEACQALIPGMDTGWEALEQAAVQAGMV